jgi:hypothetical protein
MSASLRGRHQRAGAAVAVPAQFRHTRCSGAVLITGGYLRTPSRPEPELVPNPRSPTITSGRAGDLVGAVPVGREEHRAEYRGGHFVVPAAER